MKSARFINMEDAFNPMNLRRIILVDRPLDEMLSFDSITEKIFPRFSKDDLDRLMIQIRRFDLAGGITDIPTYILSFILESSREFSSNWVLFTKGGSTIHLPMHITSLDLLIHPTWGLILVDSNFVKIIDP